MNKKKHVILIMALGALTALGPFSIDLYLPAFKVISRDLHVDISRVPLTLSSYLIGITFGQLIYGPLLDKFGRKKPLCFGLLLSMIASIGCCFAGSLEMLIILRFFQGLGSCSATVAANAMVRDYFPVQETAKVFSFLMLVLGVSPMIAPGIGSYLTLNLGWHAIFIALFVITLLLCMMVVFVLPNTYKPDPEYSLKPRGILQSFAMILKEPQFITYSICGALTLGCLFSYISAAPNLFMGQYKLKESDFAWLITAMSGGFVLSGQLNRILEKRMSSAKVVAMFSAIQVVCALIFVGVTVTGFLGISGIIVFVFVVLVCTSVCLPNSAALVFAPFRRNAGTAAALFGAFEMIAGTLVSILITVFKTNSAITLSVIMAILALLVFTICRFGQQRIASSQATTPVLQKQKP